MGISSYVPLIGSKGDLRETLRLSTGSGALQPRVESRTPPKNFETVGFTKCEPVKERDPKHASPVGKHKRPYELAHGTHRSHGTDERYPFSISQNAVAQNSSRQGREGRRGTEPLCDLRVLCARQSNPPSSIFKNATLTQQGSLCCLGSDGHRGQVHRNS